MKPQPGLTETIRCLCLVAAVVCIGMGLIMTVTPLMALDPSRHLLVVGAIVAAGILVLACGVWLLATWRRARHQTEPAPPARTRRMLLVAGSLLGFTGLGALSTIFLPGAGEHLETPFTGVVMLASAVAVFYYRRGFKD